MEWLVWLGAALTAVGLVIIAYCIAAALRVRRSGEREQGQRRGAEGPERGRAAGRVGTGTSELEEAWGHRSIEEREFASGS